jgi:hypothetical protein
MEMTWENLRTLFTWAAQQGSEPPLADTAGETIVIDGAITKRTLIVSWPLTRATAMITVKRLMALLAGVRLTRRCSPMKARILA